MTLNTCRNEFAVYLSRAYNYIIDNDTFAAILWILFCYLLQFMHLVAYHYENVIFMNTKSLKLLFCSVLFLVLHAGRYSLKNIRFYIRRDLLKIYKVWCTFCNTVAKPLNGTLSLHWMQLEVETSDPER